MISDWGPGLWRFYHTMSVNIKKKYFNEIKDEYLNLCIKMCHSLPCPMCRRHATDYMSKINKSEIKNRKDLIQLFYNFHNHVSQSKNREIYKDETLSIYKKLKTEQIINESSNILKRYFNNELFKEFTEWFDKNKDKFKSRNK